MIGTQVANYRILEKIGEGGMGVVYKGVDVNLDRPVAIKALNAQLAGNPELEQRFRNEAKAQANLNHTNLATLYTLLIEDGRPWMVMEFIEGETFEQMISRRGPIPGEEAIPLFRQALLGLGYAHRMGIVHRDIKPSNLMLNKQGIVKVMDFGIAKVMGARGMTRTGTQMGTAFYMSPEQVLNKNVDIRSDIYSLGVTLYEMLTANVPFSSDSDYQVMTDHVSTPPPLPARFYPYIPQGIQNAVLKALEKKPDARYQTVEEFGAALEQPENVATSAPVAAPVSVPVSVPAAPPAQTPPAKSSFFTLERKIIAGGLAAAVALVGGWFAFRPHSNPTTLTPVQTSGGANGLIPSSGEVLKEYKSTAPAPSQANRNTAPSSTPAQPAPKNSPTSPAPPPEPPAEQPAQPAAIARVIPAGTVIAVRLIDTVDSSRIRPGQLFDATVNAPVLAGGRSLIPQGTRAKVMLAGLDLAGHIEGRSVLKLALASIVIHGVPIPVKTNLFEKAGSSRGKASAVVIGGGAAVGAAIGGIFGHKKGAALGAASGAGAGTGERLVTKGPPVTIPSETVLQFTLSGPLNITQ